MVDCSDFVGTAVKSTLNHSDESIRSGWKDLTSSFDIQVAYFVCAKSGGKTQCDDTTGRSPGDEIEILDDRPSPSVTFFQSLQECSRKDSTNTATINGENAESSILRPRQRDTFPFQCARRPSRRCRVISGHSSRLVRMYSTPRPLARRQPSFVAGKPVNRPWNDGHGDPAFGIPLAGKWIVKAKKRPFGTVPIRVVVRDGLTRILGSPP